MDDNSISDNSAGDLLSCWRESPQPSVKLASYFPVYERLFSHLRGTRCTFVETGVLDGGSLFMWRKWLGPEARIIGVDLNPNAARWRDHGFEIIIGDQGDPSFWRKAFEEIGEFDVVLDDGGHQSFQQIVTATEAIKAARRKCLVVVEDTGTSFMKDFSKHGTRTFLNFSKDLSDLLVAPLIEGGYETRFLSHLNSEAVAEYGNVRSVEFFCGIVAFRCDPNETVDARVVRNHEPNAAADFRYKGSDQAEVIWPRLFGHERVVVKGGIGSYERAQAAKSRLANILQHLKEGSPKAALQETAELLRKIRAALARR